jgi:hypothetical protein
MQPRPNYKQIFLLAVCLLILPLQDMSFAASITPEEVRATYIIKMRPFFKVGADNHEITQICYYEKNGTPAHESVGQIMEKYYTNHTGDGVSLRKYTAIQAFSDCDLLYIAQSAGNNVENVLAATSASTALTISATAQFIYKGGMIGFTQDNANRIKMEANRSNMKEKNVQANPQILEIMSHVVE